MKLLTNITAWHSWLFCFLEKIVDVAGKGRAIEVFKETQRIEAEGGLMIMVGLVVPQLSKQTLMSCWNHFQNQTRRRTPGGVFLFLLRSDGNLTREQLGKIFDEDRQKYKEVMKMKKKMKLNSLKKKNGKSHIHTTLVVSSIKCIVLVVSNSNKDLPDLLTKAELCVQKLAEENNRTRKESSNVDVINPPPTPETDCHDNSCDGMDNIEDATVVNKDDSLYSGRKLEHYEVDFLDIGNGNTMDLF